VTIVNGPFIMRIHLVRSHDVSRELLDKVYNLLLHSDGPAQFIKEQHSCSFHDDEEVLSWGRIFARCAEYRTRHAIPADEFIILLTSKQNEKNWFSCPDPRGTRAIFVHAAEWDNYLIDCDSHFPVAFQCWENVLHSLMFRSFREGIEFSHDPPIGCITDMCSWKPDITYKLRTADVCAGCLSRLEERGASRALIDQALGAFETLRQQMLFSRNFRNTEPQESELPFPVAITRRKLSLTTEPLHKFLLLIDHFDSLVRTSVIFVGAAALNQNFAKFLEDKELQVRPSLGNWVRALQSLSELSVAFGLATLPNDLSSRMLGVVREAEEGNIVRMRNERRGHGYIDCRDAGYQSQYNSCSIVVKNIEALLTPILARLKPLLVVGTERLNTAEFQLTVKSMMGSHPDSTVSQFSYQPREVENIPCKDQCYLYAPIEGRWVPLHPYLQFKECPECRHPRVLIADGQQYLDPYVGHRVSLN
jgi:hypothetical protein